ncbi:MAG: UvrD-helicase domain-containing protein [Patescibacteria group bacterium]|nr:UvrD-helicase domain-containing protein [Patescibacteria group bacterium]
MADVKLNKEQLEAARHGSGPLLIIAGAGTGKTTVITERIKYLILEKKILPSEILALTFTEKSAREMQERVDVAMPYGYTQMWISTFHAFCDRILKSEAIHIGINPSYKLMTEAESVLFLRNNLFKFNLEYFRPLGNPNKFLESLLQHFSRLKDEDVSPAEYLDWLKSQKYRLARFAQQASRAKRAKIDEEELKKNLELVNACKIYEELKVKEGVMDFSDLISNILKLFRIRKNILKNYQNQFKYILVDEFQDTNFAQNTLAILLSGGKQNITVVGDDDQAIYRWRGAAISNIIQFKEHFKDAKIITLIKNYRSTKEILDSSYDLIQNNNPDRLEIKEKINKKLISERGIKGNEIEFVFSKRAEDEAEFVAKKIKELNKNYKYSDIAILVRANDHSQSFTRAFERIKIPYQFLGPGKLFHADEIKDLIAYLKVLYNFEESASLYRVLTNPIFNLEGIEIAKLLNLAKRKNYSLFEALEKADEIYLKPETKEKTQYITEMIRKHIKRVPKDTAGQILFYFLEDSGLLKKIISSKTQTDERKSQNIAKFFDKLKTYEVEHEDASVFAVVDWIDLSMQMGESPLATDVDWSENNAVNILTIHSSKGLEFPVVFLVNLVEQRFPTRERKEQIPIPQDLIKEILPVGDYHLEEERRLFYVGTTRARDLLFLTAANFYGEGKRERKISPFVFEIIGKNRIEKIISKKKTEESSNQLSLLEWATPLTETKTIANKITTKINYISYSQIQTFEICPLHYKLKYILKIPTAPTAAQSFGISLHSVLRDFYQLALRDEKIKIHESEKLLEKNWINDGYTSKSHEKAAFEKARLILSNYFKENFDQKIIKTQILEYPFNFFVKNLKVGGRIDRVDKISENKIEIIDYKTGSNIPTEKDIAKDLQLTTYALAATKINEKVFNKKPDEVVLSLYYLEKGQKISTTRTKEQLEEAEKYILERVKEIENSDFKCSKISLCRNCEYKILCST